MGYLEQREFDGLEERVLAAEVRVEEANARTQDSKIATDAGALQEQLELLSEAQREGEELYARWAELEGKRG